MRTTCWWLAFGGLAFTACVLVMAWSDGNHAAGLGAVGAFIVAGCLVIDRFITEGER